MKEGLDKNGQLKQIGFHFTNNSIKAVNTLYGLCMGIVADGRIEDSEVLFLDTWLKENQDYLGAYPLNVVSRRLTDILSDGVITEDEKHDLYAMLGQLIGGAVEETGSAGGGSTCLPVDAVDSIDFDLKTFCFTGKFIRGQRSVCEQLVLDRQGLVYKGVNKDLDYLVIGDLASRDWVAASHGRKIEKALYFRERGSHILILSEKDWVCFVD